MKLYDQKRGDATMMAQGHMGVVGDLGRIEYISQVMRNIGAGLPLLGAAETDHMSQTVRWLQRAIANEDQGREPHLRMVLPQRPGTVTDSDLLNAMSLAFDAALSGKSTLYRSTLNTLLWFVCLRLEAAGEGIELQAKGSES